MRDSDLIHARRIVARLQSSGHATASPAGARVYATATPIDQERYNTAVRLTPLERYDTPFASAKVLLSGERNQRQRTSNSTRYDTPKSRDRSRDLVPGQNFQIGDWVKVLNPKEDQLGQGKIIGLTRDNLIKIEGSIRVGNVDVSKAIRRGVANIEIVAEAVLHYE